MKKSNYVYFIGGTAVLIAIALMLTIYEEPTAMQETNIVETTEIEDKIKLTGTPADHYSPDEREQHCGNSVAKSNQYIQEFEIPTPCTQPLSIIADSDGKIWFAQTNTGNLAMFDPESEEFTEYENDQWDLKSASMIWGIFYTQDDEIWFTDDAHGSLWKFSIPEKKYFKFDIPTDKGKSYPQKIGFYNDNFVINDFTGNQVVVLKHSDLDENKIAPASISIPEGFFTSQASVDSDGNIWFVMWKYQKESILIKANSITHKSEQFSLPSSISAPNGVSIGPSGNIWIADTASSSFYSFDPENTKVVEYVTSNSPIWTYGNSSGLIKTPITRPYWNDFDPNGNMWFNQQTANRLAVFDPVSEFLVEYDIPSKNSKWADCGEMKDCGTSQSFGFAFEDQKVWFTEWVENKIGVLDTSVAIPIFLDMAQDNITINPGEAKEIIVTVMPKTDHNIETIFSGNASSELIKVKTDNKSRQISNQPLQVPVTIQVDEKIEPGEYKVLLGAQTPGASVSSYVTVTVI